MNINELLSSAGLTASEREAFEEVEPYIAEYLDNYRQHAMARITLTRFVTSSLIDDDIIPANTFSTATTLEMYSGTLASAVRKLQVLLPMPSNPLAHIED